MKTRIRQRVREALLDFSILFESWPAEEREKVLSNIEDDEIDEAIVDFLALLYLETKLGGRFQNRLWRGVQKAERRAAGSNELGVQINFDVEITETINMEAAVEKYRRQKYDEMNDAEKTSVLKTLRRSGTVSSEDLHESLENRREEIRRRVNEAKKNRAEYWREK